MKIERSISLRPQDDAAQLAEKQDRQLREAAKMYEQQFIREMVKAMRQNVQESGLTPSSFGEKIWREQLDNQYVENWSDRGGVGMADMIYQNIKERYFPSAEQKLPRPKGPVDIQWKGQPLPVRPDKPHLNQSAIEFRAGSLPSAEAAEVKAPWDGRVAGRFTSPEGLAVVNLRHEEGLTSRLVFPGRLANLNVGDPVVAGQTLGQVQPAAPWLQWHLTREEGLDPTS